MVAARKLQANSEDLLTKETKTTRKSGGTRTKRELSLDMIKENAMGAPVAKYIFPFIKTSGIYNNDLAAKLGYKHHSNMSMVRSGASKLPVAKAKLMAEALNMPNHFEFGLLVAENNHPTEIAVLQEMGVVISQKERDILDMIEEKVPAGEMKRFKEQLQKMLDDF